MAHDKGGKGQGKQKKKQQRNSEYEQGRTPPAFDRLDLNRDGVISPREFRGDSSTFARLDRNRDGVLSRD